MDINLDAPLMTLQETTVAYINNQRVGCGDILNRPYTLDGKEIEGLTVRLVFAETDQSIIVGEGSVFAVGDTNWRVVILRHKSEELHHGEAVIEQVL